MKILIDARLYGLENTGIGRYLVNLIEQFIDTRPETEFDLLLSAKYFSTIKLPKKWKKVRADFRQYTLEEQIKLPPLINHLRPDIVHFPHFNIPVFWKGPFVVTIHDMSMHNQGINATKLPLPFYLFKRVPYRYAFRSAIKRSLKIITPTRTVKKEIVDYFKIDSTKVFPIYEGLDGDKFKDKKQSVVKRYGLSGDYFFYVGDVYPHKNIKSVLSALSLLIRNGVNASFVIACSRGYFVDMLRDYAKKEDIEEHIRFLGFVPDEDLSSLYYYSRGLVYPSFSEGFGLQGLEAIASGTLVLASDIPVFKEIYQDYAFYFDPNSISSIASAMRYSLSVDDKKREEFIKYSWEKMATSTFELYKEALKNET
jgi:glycosyltransferase involved in cell wall biosynthesis